MVRPAWVFLFCLFLAAQGQVRSQEAEAEGEEEEEFTDVDLAEALMLLGGISFVMTMFYLVNDEDRDMRFYSWSVISATLSIFSAVLVFSGTTQMLRAYVIPREEVPRLRLVWAIGQALAFYVTMQLGTAYESCALHRATFSMSDDDEHLHKVERRTKCWATIFAHMTGFAFIHCGSRLQSLPEFRDSAALSFVAAPVLFLLGATLNWTSRRIRERALVWSRQGYAELSQIANLDTDEDDRWHEWTAELWNEYIIDAEHDAAALSVSYLLVQSCRFAFSGHLPDDENWPEGPLAKDMTYAGKLAGFSFLFALLTIVAVIILRRTCGPPAAPGSCKSFMRRCLILTQNSAAMAFAWSLLYHGRWEIARYSKYVGQPVSLTSRIILALGVSFVALFMTRMLDCVVDMNVSGKVGGEALCSLINALGILVGFSWEQSFDGGVEVLAARTANPEMAQLALAVCVVTLILPAWRRHILQTVIRLQKERMEVSAGTRTDSRKISVP